MMIQSARFLPKLFTNPGLSFRAGQKNHAARLVRRPTGALAFYAREHHCPFNKMRSDLNNCKARSSERPSRTERNGGDIPSLARHDVRLYIVQMGHRDNSDKIAERRKCRPGRRGDGWTTILSAVPAEQGAAERADREAAG